MTANIVNTEVVRFMGYRSSPQLSWLGVYCSGSHRTSSSIHKLSCYCCFRSTGFALRPTPLRASTYSIFLDAQIQKAIVSIITDPIMDPDLHRQKRSRVASAAARSDPSSNCDGQDEQTNPPLSRLSTTTSALQNLSFRDDQQSAQNNQKKADPDTTIRPFPQNPTPPTTFFSDPSFQQNGAATSNFSFNPAVSQHRLFSHPTPPPSFPRAAASPNNFQGHSLPKDAGTRINASSNVLPVHRSRPIQPFSGFIAGPSSKQAERDASHPPPQQSPAHSPCIFPGYQPNPSPIPQINPRTAIEQSKTLNHKSSRPQPIYIPTSEQGKTTPSFAYSDNRTSASSLDTGRLLLDAHRETAKSYSNFAEARKPAEGVRPALGNKPYLELPGSRFAAGTFPYPSIYPANERRPHDNLELPQPRSPPGYPPNYYTSPNRVPNAAYVASRKRKRGWPAVAPEAYIYTRTNSPNFSIFGGILLYPELCFALAANLPVKGLISLYAISKDFHTIIDTRFATVVLGQALRKCPESSRVFPFRCYKYLCRSDPAPRIPHPHPAKQVAGEIRNVPSFRWLRMVLYREKVCHEIMTFMAEDGIPLPSRCELAIKRMWFMMDVPDNARRIGYIHTKKLVTDLDLYFIMCFILKLDLRFNDPNAPNRYHGLRKIILAQQGLVPLWRALNRSTLLTRHDVLKMWVAAKHNPPREEEGLPMFGVPGDRIGKTRMEYFGKRSTHDTGKPCTFLLRPDQLVMREIIRRKIIFSKHFLRCLLWGYVDIVTMENYPPRTWDRKIEGLNEDYEYDDECGGYGTADDGKDDLLDLGIAKPISMLVKQNYRATDQGIQKRDDTFLEQCMKWFKDENKGFDTDKVN
jgi:hypothetical protein